MLNNITITHHKGPACIGYEDRDHANFSKVAISSDYSIKLPHSYNILPKWVVNCIIDHERGHAIHGDLERTSKHSFKQRLVSEIRADGYAATIHGPVMVFMAMILSEIAESMPCLKKNTPMVLVALLSPLLLVVWMVTFIFSVIDMMTHSTNVRIWQLLVPRKKGYYNRFKESDVKINKLISLKYKGVAKEIEAKMTYIKSIDNHIVSIQNCIDCGLEGYDSKLKENIAERDELLAKITMLQSIEYVYS